jgi:acetolactate synthase I/II/III large subunit
MKLSDYVADFFAEKKIEHFFTLSGGGCMHLLDSLGNHPALRYTCSLHEQAAAIGAEAYAQFKNQTGVVLVTTGPGGTNAVTGVAGAFIESTPLFILSGQVKRQDLKPQDLRQLGPQEVDIVSIVKPITKYAVTITDPSTIRFELEKAWHLSNTGRPGPVWLDIPLDVQASMIEVNNLKSYTLEPLESRIPDKIISQTITALLSSKRPVILAGNGVRLSGAQADFEELIGLLKVPLLLTWKTVDFIDETHPLLCGRPGSIAQRGANITQQKSDWILTLGARLDVGQTAFNPLRFAPRAKKIIVDIDPQETWKMGTDILAVNFDVGEFIRAMNVKLKTLLVLPDWSQWLHQSKALYLRFRDEAEEDPASIKDVSLYRFIDTLAEISTTTDVIVPGSSGACSEVTLQRFKVKKGQRILNTLGLGSMGFGLPASIGACLASGNKRTILINGDGGIQLNIQELETIRRLNLPIKIFILQNHGYRSIVITQKNFFKGRMVASDDSSGVTLPSMKKLAAVYDFPYYEITHKGELAELVSKTLETPGPVICDVRIDPNHFTLPRVKSQILPNGNIESMPMENLYPFLSEAELKNIMEE